MLPPEDTMNGTLYDSNHNPELSKTLFPMTHNPSAEFLSAEIRMTPTFPARKEAGH